MKKAIILTFFIFILIISLTYAEDDSQVQKLGTSTCFDAHPCCPCSNSNDNNTATLWQNAVNDKVFAWINYTNKNVSVTNITIQFRTPSQVNTKFAIWYYDYTINNMSKILNFTTDDNQNRVAYKFNNTNVRSASFLLEQRTSEANSVDLAEWFLYNGSFSPDLLPPHITYYNLTNTTIGSTGCENWNTNKNNPCSTSAVTPTVQFNTNENAKCRISGNASSTLGQNYTDMGSSRQCSAGENTQSHLCTLTLQDELIYDTSYIYLSCQDFDGNQNRTSTSGPLALNVTGLEATARSSMELGIRNSLSSSYTVYTDQKIYARNSANTQSVGTFDKVAKKLSKIWAFNRIGGSDAFVNMFNITPVLYTLEFANVTNTNITNQVEKLINSTR